MTGGQFARGGKTFHDKIWDARRVGERADGMSPMCVGRHPLREVTLLPLRMLCIDQPREQGRRHRSNLRVGEIEFGTGGDDPAPGRSP